MARNFDGTNDKIAFGSDGSIDNYNSGKTISFWMKKVGEGGSKALLMKDASTSTWVFIIGAGVNLTYAHQWTTGNGIWTTTATISAGSIQHVAVTYDAGALANDAVIYIDGVAQALGVDTNPTVGPVLSDAADILQFGENSAGGSDFNGVIMCLLYDNRIASAATINMARWWGRPIGGLQVYHPFFTDKLNNEGSAIANGTATGTTVASMAAPVVRPGTAMMGMGIGW